MKQFYCISLFMSSVVVLQAAAETCCMILSPEDRFKDCDAFYWPEIIKNLPMSCTKLQFSPRNYMLTENLKITAVNNFSIVGNGATFECVHSSIVIKGSIGIRIENARFLNCGCSTHNTTTMSAISLHNSSSVTIINVVIENSDGYGIIGVNLAGKCFLENITIFHTNYNKHFHSKQQSMTGGIVLFSKNTHHSNVSAKLVMKHCTISNITSNHKIKHGNENNEIPSELLNFIVGLMFYQHPETIEIQIHNLTITNTISVYGSLLLVSVNSDSLNLTISSSGFVNNKNSLHPMINFLLNITYPGSILTIINCEFNNNGNYTHILKMNNVANDTVALVVENVKMINNIVAVGVFNFSGIIPLLKGYTEFSNNTASIIFSFGEYVQLDEEAQLLISNNKYNPAKKTLKRYIFEKTNPVSKECPLQFNATTSTVNITFCNNVGYYREMHSNYLEYNCTWNQGLNKNFLLPKEIYKNAMSNCGWVKKENFRWSSSFFLCNITSDYAIKHNKQYIVPHLYYHHDKLYPGQAVLIKLIHLRYKISVYTDFEGTKFSDIAPMCQLSTLKHKVDIIYKSCTELHYTIKSNSTSNSMCLLKLKTAEKKSTTLIFKINVSSCPIGFTLDYTLGECKCNPKLEATLNGITCRISDMTFTLGVGWMSKINNIGNRNEMMYTDFCFFDYCTLSPYKIIMLDNVDSQCLPGRTGIMCGQCANGLSTVFGTSQCKKCSNSGLFMIPIFAIIGLLIVIMLFVLNLTIVNGNFYGFIFFVNTISISTLELFATKREIAYTLILLFNLDLGIEVCFYNGMTTYASIWLQFLFPIYLLLIVAGLVVASRYSSKIERITRKKVIPVIATLYLLSYNKIMIITFKGLFSFTRIHYLSSGETRIYWPLDTDISVGNYEFILLFLFCGIVLVILIIPTNIVLLFTRKCYRFRFVATYLRPFIDVYQAPFKDNYRYFLGFELFLRAVVYIVKFTRTQYTPAIFCVLIILFAAYLSWHKPFINNFSMLLYLLYIFLLGGITIAYLHYNVYLKGPSETFKMILNLLVYLAFIETLLILVHHWWKYHLCYCKIFIEIEKYTKAKLHKHFMFTKKSAPCSIPLQEVHSYAEYQEELLALSPNV